MIDIPITGWSDERIVKKADSSIEVANEHNIFANRKVGDAIR